MKNPSIHTLIIGLLICLTPVLLQAQDAASDDSLTWSYPIQVPSGRNGIGPSLSINYNSFGGNSFLGMGMQLGGLSAITRDQSYRVFLEEGKTDHYLLDGQKLIFAGEEAGGSRRYRPERETYQQITASGDPNDTDTYWVVTAKNGTMFFYGYEDSHHTTANDGAIEAVGKDGKKLIWCLNRVEDVHGNYYTIEYLEDSDDGDYYPVQITYTLSTQPGEVNYHGLTPVAFPKKQAPLARCLL